MDTTDYDSTQPKNDMLPFQPDKRFSRYMSVVLILLLIIAVCVGATMYLARSKSPAVTTKPVEIAIANGAFIPATVVIHKGQSVVWANQDDAPHQIAAELAENATTKNLNSQEVLQKRDTYTFTFQETGTFHYADTLNPTSIKGTVVVE